MKNRTLDKFLTAQTSISNHFNILCSQNTLDQIIKFPNTDEKLYFKIDILLFLSPHSQYARLILQKI